MIKLKSLKNDIILFLQSNGIHMWKYFKNF
jgi:hypothetical protein